jgi:hypothetical protein
VYSMEMSEIFASGAIRTVATARTLHDGVGPGQGTADLLGRASCAGAAPGRHRRAAFYRLWNRAMMMQGGPVGPTARKVAIAVEMHRHRRVGLAVVRALAWCGTVAHVSRLLGRYHQPADLVGRHDHLAADLDGADQAGRGSDWQVMAQNDAYLQNLKVLHENPGPYISTTYNLRISLVN